jgi:predicted nucleic acid-binding protein
MIAASALNAGDALATSNVADFKRFEPLGLRLG